MQAASDPWMFDDSGSDPETCDASTEVHNTKASEVSPVPCTERDRSRSRSPRDLVASQWEPLDDRPESEPDDDDQLGSGGSSPGGASSGCCPMPPGNDPFAAPYKQPAFPAGTDWWASVLWQAFASERRARPADHAISQFRHESVCSGTMMELFAAEAMDLNWSTISGSERKQFARAFCMRNHGQRLQHLFHEFSNQASDIVRRSCDVCYKLGQGCTYDLGSNRPHLCMGGLPCQPWSSMRNQKGNTGDTGSANAHSKFKTVFTDFMRYLEVRRPFGFIIEEVAEFARKPRGAPQGAPAPLDAFCEQTAAFGFYTQAMELITSTWLHMARPRLFIIGISAPIGGRTALEWIIDKVQEAFSYRGLGDPTDIWQILKMDATHESWREMAVEAMALRMAWGWGRVGQQADSGAPGAQRRRLQREGRGGWPGASGNDICSTCVFTCISHMFDNSVGFPKVLWAGFGRHIFDMFGIFLTSPRPAQAADTCLTYCSHTCSHIVYISVEFARLISFSHLFDICSTYGLTYFSVMFHICFTYV